MKLADLRRAEEEFSAAASEISRKLGYAGLAIIWIFKVEFSTGAGILPNFVPATILIAVGLILDLLQYLFGATAWGFFGRKKESDVNFDETQEFLGPNWIVITLDVFFYAKIVFIGLAYASILSELVQLGFFVASGTPDS